MTEVRTVEEIEREMELLRHRFDELKAERRLALLREERRRFEEGQEGVGNATSGKRA